MKNEPSLFWRFRRYLHRQSREPGAALFSGLRLRLTLWYSSVLAIALIFFGVTLYFGVQQLLLSPVSDDLISRAQHGAQEWLTISPDHPCSMPSLPLSGYVPHDPILIACFDQSANLLQEEDTPQLPTAFLDTSLALKAMQNGSASGIIDTGGPLGQVDCYALGIPGPDGKSYLGAIVVGKSVQPQETALSIILTLLFAVGGVTMLGAVIGGLFLSHRALVPARLAWNNQQRFIADASHELRTPLTLLRADAEVLLRSRKGMDPEDAELLEDIVTEASHMTTLANNMLTLARLDAGSQHREHEVVSLDTIVQAGLRRVTAFADQKGITLQAEVRDDLRVIGDPLLLEQALLVLLDNAIKYNHAGGSVTIHTSLVDQQAQIAISDNGIGIPAEHLPNLGERFYRVDKARSRAAGGTGLGLSIARSIATSHDGSLRLESTPHEGTRALLTLPAASSTLGQADSEIEILPPPIQSQAK
ncbi:hypothetical protein KSC_098850 [Ktedonobacter sp. SOSP1-52]|uniref:sensor histidine kinase n=1 Tax=Ktedonobacter sp. SOSP1-52 TaxID=2778366 RepID=UPI001916BB39|nr:ATP-binding protein [Ktedonobacter sp. SOSP1-52]GHO70993.1 hypothetical protein KSC_098850 [Ktedonobacter sp. SOSP1-52]